MFLANKYARWCVAALAALLLWGCNAQKKNTAAARQYTAFITRYNIHYNGDTHFRETLHDMETEYQDDYSRLVFTHPVEAKGDEKAPQPKGNFDRSIEKAQKAIQIRSIKKKPPRKSGKGNDQAYKEWMKRDEYNPFLHNSWMMMGRSQYYNGDFLGAASTFFYISKHFTWLPSTITEAKLWQAQSYVSLDWLYEAELILTRIKPDELTSKELRRLYALAYADFWVKSGDLEKAVPFIVDAISMSSGAQKTRLQFLLGQAYSRLGQKKLAYEAFQKAGSSSSAPYRTKFNARIKQSEVYDGADIEPEVKALRRMTRYDRNKEYLDQIYYAIGNLYLSRKDTLNAIANYELAAEKSTRNGIDKAISQLQLGSLYFDLRNYEKAQPCYSEAVPQLPESYPDYKGIKRRSDVLDELAVYSTNVNLQDSLLRLAAMPEEERLKVIDKIIDDLKKKEKEEAEAAALEEYNAQAGANQGSLQDQNSREFNISTDNSWYFYNTASKNSGRTEFQKRWGSRKLEDNWRRRNKSSFNVSDFDSKPEGEEEEEDSEGGGDDSEQDTAANDSIDDSAAKLAEDPHNREYYLAQIPFTDEEKQTSHEVIQEGLYNLGVILKDKLEDNDAAFSQFDRLLTDYPDNTYRLDVYYNLYLMYMRQGNKAAAEKYRRLILSDFADSPYGQALQNPDYLENLRNQDAVVANLYEQAYDSYMNNDNRAVHAARRTMDEKYPLSPLMPKFMFIDALACVTEKDFDQFNSILRNMLERFPDTDLTPIASSWLKGMAQGKQLQAGESNMRGGNLWDIHLSTDSAAFAADSVAAGFEINEDAPQLLVLVFPTDEINANALLYEVARFNFNSFVVRDFDLELMNFGRLGMLIIRGFDNQQQLNHYRSTMAQSALFSLPAGVRPVAISADNFDKLLNQGRTFDDYFRFLEEQNYIDAQAGILAPAEVEPLPDEPEQPVEQPIEQPAVEQPVESTPAQPQQPVQQPQPVQPQPVDPTPAGSEDDPLLSE